MITVLRPSLSLVAASCVLKLGPVVQVAASSQLSAGYARESTLVMRALWQRHPRLRAPKGAERAGSRVSDSITPLVGWLASMYDTTGRFGALTWHNPQPLEPQRSSIAYKSQV